jgi:hypothetical protein
MTELKSGELKRFGLVKKEESDDILAQPGVVGYVKVDNVGIKTIVSGQYAESLGDFLNYFCEIANLIGDSFGMDPMEEGQIRSDTITAVCFPRDEITGIILDAKIKPEEFFLKNPVDELP